MIPFVRQFDFEYGKAQALSPLVTRVIANNPGPFTFTGTGVFIIGTDEVAVIDPGPLLPDHIKALDKALEGKTVTHVFLTHHHADHSPLAAPLARKHNCKVYGRSLENGAHKNTGIEAGNDAHFNPDVHIVGGEIFTGKDWTLEAIHTPGHTSNHICFALRQDNTLFSGDHIMGWSTSIVSPPDGHMGDYLRALKDIERRNFTAIRPTHGTTITEPEAFVRAYIDHRYAREEQIGAVMAKGVSNIEDMVKHIYIGLDSRLYPAAALNVLAHLIHLQEIGCVLCKGEPSLRGKFTVAEMT